MVAVVVVRQWKGCLWPSGAGSEQSLKRNQCLPDKLTPEDIARMVLFLASDDGAMCTAQEFMVDAGWVRVGPGSSRIDGFASKSR